MERLAAAVLGDMLQIRGLECQVDLVHVPACLLLAMKCSKSILTSEVQFPKYLKFHLQRIVCRLHGVAFLPGPVLCSRPGAP